MSPSVMSHSSCALAPEAYSTLKSVTSLCPVFVVAFGSERIIDTSSLVKHLIPSILGSLFFGILDILFFRGKAKEKLCLKA